MSIPGRQANGKRLTRYQRDYISYIKAGNSQDNAIKKAYPPRDTWTPQQLAVYRKKLSQNKVVQAELEKFYKKRDEEIVKAGDNLKLTPNYVLKNLKEIVEDGNAANKDRLRALELIGKNLHMFADQRKGKGSQHNHLHLTSLPVAQLKQLLTPPGSPVQESNHVTIDQ